MAVTNIPFYTPRLPTRPSGPYIRVADQMSPEGGLAQIAAEMVRGYMGGKAARRGEEAARRGEQREERGLKVREQEAKTREHYYKGRQATELGEQLLIIGNLAQMHPDNDLIQQAYKTLDRNYRQLIQDIGGAPPPPPKPGPPPPGTEEAPTGAALPGPVTPTTAGPSQTVGAAEAAKQPGSLSRLFNELFSQMGGGGVAGVPSPMAPPAAALPQQRPLTAPQRPPRPGIQASRLRPPAKAPVAAPVTPRFMPPFGGPYAALPGGPVAAMPMESPEAALLDSPTVPKELAGLIKQARAQGWPDDIIIAQPEIQEWLNRSAR